jgi:hypothetical protein
MQLCLEKFRVFLCCKVVSFGITDVSKERDAFMNGVKNLQLKALNSFEKS